MFIIGLVRLKSVIVLPSGGKEKRPHVNTVVFNLISSSPVLLGPPQPGHADVLRVCCGLRSACQLQRCHGGHGKYN